MKSKYSKPTFHRALSFTRSINGTVAALATQLCDGKRGQSAAQAFRV